MEENASLAIMKSAQELKEKMDAAAPDNESRSEGYAFVNVLSADSFAARHIPGSINIPRAQVDDFEEKFDKSKEIVVYCASPTCQASPAVAAELVRRGFENVIAYEGGLSEWVNAGYSLEGDAVE